MAHRLDHRPNQLSGGEQQRVAIARALVTQPNLLLADEPTGNLDTKTGAEIMRLLRTVNEEHGCALVVITHDLEVAAQAPRQIRLRDGVLEDAAPAEEVAPVAHEASPAGAPVADEAAPVHPEGPPADAAG